MALTPFVLIASLSQQATWWRSVQAGVELVLEVSGTTAGSRRNVHKFPTVGPEQDRRAACRVIVAQVPVARCFRSARYRPGPGARRPSGSPLYSDQHGLVAVPESTEDNLPDDQPHRRYVGSPRDGTAHSPIQHAASLRSSPRPAIQRRGAKRPDHRRHRSVASR